MGGIDAAGWTDNSATLLRYQVLVELARIEDGVLGDGQSIACSLAVDGRAVGDVLDSLAAEGMVQTYESSLAPGYTTDATLTASGQAAVDGWLRLQGSSRASRACGAAMLDWLDSARGPASTDEFVGDVRAHCFGLPFELEFVRSTARDLKAAGLIAGAGTWGGPVLRPTLTAAGQSVLVDRGGDLGPWRAGRPEPGASIHISNSPGAVVSAHSPGAVQVVEVGPDVTSKLMTLANALEGLLPVLGLDEDQRTEAARLAVELRQTAASSEAEQPRVRGMLARVEQIAIGGTGAATGAGLVALAQLALGAL